MSLLWKTATDLWGVNPHGREEPPVEEMPAHEFAKKYPPSAYGKTWDKVAHDPDFHEGGDEGWDHEDLAESVYNEGIHNPVQIDGFGEVGDGHHRVIHAIEHNVPVRFQDWSK